MKTHKVIITTALLLIPALASAATIGLPGLPVNTSTDLSIKLLNMILGNDWYSWLSGTAGTGPGSALASMLKIYNNIILSVVALLIVYTYVTGIADTAHKGKVLGDKYSTMWTPIRQAGAIAALIPIPGLGGISLIQGLVAWLIMASIGLANAVWDGGLTYMVNNGGGMSPPTSSFYNLPSNVIVGVADVAAETAALQEPVADGGPGLTTTGFTCSVTGFNNKKIVCGLNPFSDSTGNIMKGGLGTITASCIDSSQGGQTINTCSAEAKALRATFMSVYKEVGAVAVSHGAGSLSSFASNIGTIKTAFSNTINTSIQTAFSHISTSAGAGLSKFTNTAKADGWASAGMFFYELGRYNNAYQKATEINISYTPGGGSLISAIPPSINGVLSAISQDVTHSPDSQSALIAAASQSASAGTATSQKSSILTQIGEIVDNAVGSGLKNAINYIISPPGAGASNALNPVDPIVQLQAFGDKVTWAADSIMTGYAGAYVAAAMTKNAGKSLIGQISNVFDAGGTQVVATVAAGASKLFSFFSGPVLILVMLLAVIGFELAFYLPIAPAILFGFAVVEWLIAVIETLLAAPLWAAAHAMPTGDGFTGDHGKKGYAFLMALLVRPVLTVFGLFIALSIMSTVVYFMALSFNVAFASANTGFNGPYDTIMELVLLAGVMLVTVNKAIQVITRLPSTVLNWIGGESSQPAGREELAAVGGYASGGHNATTKVIQGATGQGKGGTQGAGAETPLLTKLQQDAGGGEGTTE
ncbi:DotA/TraY family protein [Acidithiobacillus ferrivorans]|nr:DotA/TraY family protein [Acidithiobacillus ferrivorans]